MARLKVLTPWGTFTRNTDRTYTHVVIGRRQSGNGYEALGWATSQRNAESIVRQKLPHYEDVQMVPIPAESESLDR